MKDKLLLVLLATFFTSGLIAGGGQEGIGGDSMAWEFKNIGQSVYFWLSHSEKKLSSGLKAKPFFTVLNGISVESTDDPARVTVKGVVKEAVSYLNQNKVVLYRPFYRKIDDEKKKWLLVVHEISHFLAQMEPSLADEDYGVSSELVRKAFPEMLRPSDYFGSLIDCSQRVPFPAITYATKQGIRMFIDPVSGLTALEYYVGDFLLNSHYKVRIGDRLTCYYSKTKAGLIQCRDFGNAVHRTEFNVIQVDRQDPLSSHAFTTYELWVNSPEVRELYAANRFHFAPSPNQFLTVKGHRPNPFVETTIPLIPDVYTWTQGMTFAEEGSKGLGSLFRMNFRAGECKWTTPKPLNPED